MNWALVTVEITCRNDKIYVALKGSSASDYFNNHVPGRVELVEAQIRSLLAGSFAAKWRKRVIIQRVIN